VHDNNTICCIHVELFKSLKGVECDIECPALATFIMVHHYLACTIVKTDMPAFVVFIYVCICREAATPNLYDSFVLGDCAVIATSLSKSARLRSPN
jgi:hypothetical protein